MLKKLITLMMVFSIFTTTAFAGSQAGLKAAFDELNYSLSVEWDQKDKKVYDAHMKKFTETLRGLQKAGLTNAELVEFIKTQVKDASVARDVETTLNMISLQKMSSSQAAEQMSNIVKKSYAQGASWNGDAMAIIYVGLGVLLIAAALAAAANGTYGGGYGGGCYGDVYVCDTYCYDDYYWGYYCEDDCYYSCY